MHAALGAGMMPLMRPILALMALAIAFAAAAVAAPVGPCGPQDDHPGIVPGLPGCIEGAAEALDGDTIRMVRESGKHLDIRLWGIDAPEMNTPDGSGLEARQMMDSLLLGHPVGCRILGTDRHDRLLAICSVLRLVSIENVPDKKFTVLVDIGKEMIAAGWAVEYRKVTRPVPAGLLYSVEAYAQAEAIARRERRGQWKLKYGE